MVFSRTRYSKLAFFLGFLASAHSVSVSAVQFSCAPLFSKYIAAGYDDLQTVDLSLYEKANSVLFLSDGLSQSHWLQMGKKVSAKYPEKKIVSADFNYRGPTGSGNLQFASVDNTRQFPFESNSFDLVVMRRGLCVCRSERCCGGILPTSAEAEQFFREAVRVMNKKNPNARVILHGSYGVTSGIVTVWKNFLEKIEREMGVSATFYYADSNAYFLGIGIQPVVH